MTRAPSETTSRPRRASARALDVPEIINCVRDIVATHGIEGLSMRALARELGVSPMAAYHHVGSKEDLLALLVDDVLKEVEVPPREFGTWEERLRELNQRSNTVLATLPGLAEVVFSQRLTEQTWRLMDGYIGILLDAGFSEHDAALGFSVLHSYGAGRVGLEKQLLKNRERRIEPPADADALRRIHGQWRNLHRADYRTFALEIMIAGLRSLLPPETQR